MRRSKAIPDSIEASLGRAFGSRLAPSESSVAPLHRETTICYSYMCPYAYGCGEKSGRPAQVLKRRCMRYLPETMRIKLAVSDHALDILARRRDKGQRLASQTVDLLERVRPDGPLRKRA